MMSRRGKSLVFSWLALSAAVCFAPIAQARSAHGHRVARVHHHRGVAHRASRHYGGVLQCVAFVKQTTDFNIRGNARDWWGAASGRFARGGQPEEGAVLAFRGTRRMPLGHVSLVSSIVDSRTILVDHSHWASPGISRNVRVVDVSPNNDWSAVRVALNGNSDRLGSIYPTHGFIYSRPDNATGHQMVLARNTARRTSHTVWARSRMQGGIRGIETASVPNAMEVFDDDAPNRALR